MCEKHPACRECVLDNDCLLQENKDTDECQDVREYDLKEKRNGL